jgi:DNA-binding transcriptional LysR family regulator
VRIEPRLVVNNADTAIAAAEAGMGITRALSYQVRASVMARRLLPVLQNFVPPPIPVSAVYRARRIASANLTTFVRAARDYFKSDPLVPVEDW